MTNGLKTYLKSPQAGHRYLNGSEEQTSQVLLSAGVLVDISAVARRSLKISGALLGFNGSLQEFSQAGTGFCQVLSKVCTQQC